MDSGEYFDRVVRFLETKGWNTARSRIGTGTYVVTGTRESDTYYDRMLTLVAVAEDATLSRRHVEYLVEAGTENDVDHLLATARGGIDDDAAALADESGVTVLATETIDDAFIDGFSTDEEFDDGGVFGGALTGDVGTARASIGSAAAYPLALYSLVGLVAALFVALLGALGAEEPVPTVAVAGGVLFAGPLLAVLAGVSVPAGTARESSVGLFVGTGGGYLVLSLLLGAGSLLAGGASVLDSPARLVAVVSFAVPTGVLAVATAQVRDRLATASADGTGG
jgi:hypothetical protein